jgi:transposase-like protein
VQLCLVHKARNSLKYVPWKERKAVAADLRAIYGAATLTAAEQALERFAERWDAQYPGISPSWLADWDRLTVLFDYPPATRRVIYTTNAIESLNYSLRKRLKTRGTFPNDASIVKVLYTTSPSTTLWDVASPQRGQHCQASVCVGDVASPCANARSGMSDPFAIVFSVLAASGGCAWG